MVPTPNVLWRGVSWALPAQASCQGPLAVLLCLQRPDSGARVVCITWNPGLCLGSTVPGPPAVHGQELPGRLRGSAGVTRLASHR